MYAVHLLDEAKADLGALARSDQATARLISNKLKWLGENAETLHHHALHGPWAGYFKQRVRDYRIVYQIDHKTSRLYVLRIRHRSEVYDI